MLLKTKNWIEKYDIWSLSIDFFFVIGVLVLGWNPIALFILFMVDTSVMSLFTVRLFYLERKSRIEVLAFIIVTLIVFALMAMLHVAIISFIKDLKMQKVVNADPFQIINPVILPILLVGSYLNHRIEYNQNLQRMHDGTYKSGMIKHFFSRYFLLAGLILFIICFLYYFQAGIVVAFILIKSYLRIFYPRTRELL